MFNVSSVYKCEELQCKIKLLYLNQAYPIHFISLELDWLPYMWFN